MEYIPGETLTYITETLEYPLKELYERFSTDDQCPSWAPVFGSLGASVGLFFANAGAAYGIAISCLGFLALGKVKRLEQAILMKGIIPAILASVRGVYGLIISILISIGLTNDNYSLYKGFAHLFSGLCVGLSGYASGYCMGIVGNMGMRAVGKKPALYMGVILMIIFAEAIGLYGLIIALLLLTNGNTANVRC